MVVEIAVLVLGLVVALVRTTRAPALFPLRALAVVYTDVFRGVPTILVVYLVASACRRSSSPGCRPTRSCSAASRWRCATRAYVAEVYRAGIDSVHPSQRQAALAVGLTGGQALRYVVLPQAVRRVLPPLLNDFISLQKDVALVVDPRAAGGVPGRADRRVVDFNYTPLLAAAALYLCVTIPLARVLDRMQRAVAVSAPAGHRGPRASRRRSASARCCAASTSSCPSTRRWR